ncbi:permease prefix domain 1-containing protein [Microbacterium sp. CFBP9034]|uniref:permease prefix domain 1-containing protein n=1 Tax=Microbacterium sp. CFBP9034 TaxID=3096540 RepID=UPI002A69F546|nr:permease prefix domain 1-containing protein [Microbacterium sp. CFBP9034]MDY0908586.1 permease prefix domain 1-containing protein [Microbacterium sp. CFBP9034]
MSPDLDPLLEQQITAWREYVGRREAIADRDVDELEDHLRDQIERLETSGLAPDEAFLVAVKRMGGLDDLSREFAREHSERLWKQLVIAEPEVTAQRSRSLLVAVGLAVAAAVTIKIPALFGIGFSTDGEFYARNAAVLILPFLAAYFLIRHRASALTVVAVAAPFAAAALVLNLYPFGTDAATLALAAIHAVVALWIVTGIAYANGDVGSSRARMDFIRFTGEWFVYFVLIALGGVVLVALTLGVFSAIGLDAQSFVEDWMIPCGVAGAVVIAGWLVEAKQSVIENIAPVLTKLFTPLFTVLLLVFFVAGLLQQSLAETAEGATETFGQRDLLIIFDIVLVVVLGLLLYAMSARDPLAPPSWFDRLQLVMVVAAILVDLLVLIAMIGRIAEYGASANKLASLGLNLILLANLTGAAWLQLRFVRGRTTYERLERWQTGYVPVYLFWSAIVIVVFPPVFGFA